MQLVTVTTKRTAVRVQDSNNQPVIHRRGRAQVRAVEPLYSMAGDIQLFKNNYRRDHKVMLEALHLAFGGSRLSA